MNRFGSPDVMVTIVPAHNEEVLLGGTLESIAVAARGVHALGIATASVVVADACTDATARVAVAAGAHVVVTGCRQVGQARAAGCAEVLRRFEGVPRERLWLAHTDADTRVRASWLRTQADVAAAGHDMFVGTVVLGPGHGPGLAGADQRRAWSDTYLRTHGTDTEHGHVHGANLGMRASTYLIARGFPALHVHEDRALVDRCVALGARVTWVRSEPVITSPRVIARAPGGVGRDLASALR